MSSIETLYATFLIVALVLNGVAIAGSTPMRTIVAPLREPRSITTVLLIDIALVPLVIVGTALLLGVDPVTRAGLVIVGAASCGPIGIALARIARGDIPLSITLVVGLGALNLITLPLVTALLLPEGLTLPTGTLITSLLGLAVAPLMLGRVIVRLLGRSSEDPSRTTRLLERARRLSDVSLGAAVTVALLLEPRAIADALTGPVPIVAVVTMAAVGLAAGAATNDRARRRTIAVTINARAVGLGLAVVTLHLGDVEGLRAVVLAYGGLTQILPVLALLANDRFGPGRTSTKSRR